MIKKFLKEKRLGIAEDGGRYDLPFNKDEGTDFLTLLIGLMTFLAVLALCASFVLSSMSARWISGLENKITIEIPAEKERAIRNPMDIKTLEERVAVLLRTNQNIESFEIMERAEIQALLEPWLGKDALIDTVPMPGLISVNLRETTPEILEQIRRGVKGIDESIVVDTHESWLSDLLRLTGTMQFATLVITLIIAATTVMAVAGGVRSRIAIHRADVELLHLMGASDEYITKQFQRHTLTLALKGGAAGLIGAALTFLLIHAFSHAESTSLVPKLAISAPQMVLLIITPLIGAGIAAATARFTVLRALSQMP